MNLLVGALTIGLILSLLALGIYISFCVFDFADITVDGTFTLGAAVAAVLLVQGVHPLWATLAGTVAGAVAGTITGVLHTRFGIHGLLSGILVMTALYSVNLHVMGRSNVPLLSSVTWSTHAEQFGAWLWGGAQTIHIWGWELTPRDTVMLAASFVLALAVAAVMYLFFRTHLGTALRGTGDNPQMMRALGMNTKLALVAGLGLANALAALSGALLAQYQGFADVQMGIGMIVLGLASVIIGQALVRTRQLGLTICGAVLGAVLFRLLVAIALRFGLNPNDLKLMTAAFVFVALVLPGFIDRVVRRKKA